MPRGRAISSKRQLRFMYAAAAGKVRGVSRKIAKKLISETTRKRRSNLMKGRLRARKRK